MTATDHSRFAEWDASYVLGALSPADRKEYEDHLATCPLCREAVAELAPLPGLLARTRPEQGTTPPLPDDLVERMIDRDRRSASRRRGRLWALAAAILLVVVLGVSAAVQLHRLGGPEPVAMSPQDGTGMTAELTVESVAWGTRLSIECTYPDAWGGDASYALQVTDADGVTTRISTWNAVPGRTATMEAATALSADDIASIEITDADGDVLLSSPVDG